MAQEEQAPTRTTPPKRLARAKVKHPAREDATPAVKGKGSIAPGASRTTKARLTAQAQRELEAKQATERREKLGKIGIGAFAVIMALAMMIPSLASIFSVFGGSSTSAPEVQETTATTDATSDGQTETLTGVALVDANYEPEVATLEARLAEEPENLAALLNLGKLYMTWGYNASYYAATDAENLHVSDLFDTAIGYYDRYLALNDSNAVKVDRALCELYSGDYASSLASLEALVEEAPDYGPAWANLGMLREYGYDTEGAKEAYAQAIATDPDDEYGAKTYASQRLAALNADAMESGGLDLETTPQTGLSETLADASGTSF